VHPKKNTHIVRSLELAASLLWSCDVSWNKWCNSRQWFCRKWCIIGNYQFENWNL